MISPNLEKALNKQLNLELYSAYVYAAMAAHFEHKHLNGFANWMRLQVKEEVDHAIKFYAYIGDISGRIELDAIAKPPTDFKTVLSVFEDSLAHERTVTTAIYKLMDLALSESHHATSTFLQWFVTEQVEEEKVADDIRKRLELVGNSPEGLFMLDHELGLRKAGESDGKDSGS
ncbi:MAG: ferritin [Candidatus Hydrogenedentes bacterium]|nr:ferritin [Candidatus Hydrogenedentota bacterium]